MRMESTKAFIERMEIVKVFTAKNTTCKTLEEQLACCKAEGYDFTAEELKLAGNIILSDEDLNNVVGGGVSPDSPYYPYTKKQFDDWYTQMTKDHPR